MEPDADAGDGLKRVGWMPLEDAAREGLGEQCRGCGDEDRADDLDITEVGREIKMPWETDGRSWHTQDRVDRRGNPCKWDGQTLARVVDRIHELGDFSDTNWNSRSVVEIAARKKSPTSLRITQER